MENNTTLYKFSKKVIDLRYLIIIIFIIITIFSALNINKTNVVKDYSTFLPETTETRIGLKIMNSEFDTYAKIDYMISNITYENAQKISEEIAKVPHVLTVSFDDTGAHYKDMCANIVVMFDGNNLSEEVKTTNEYITQMISDYDNYIYFDIYGDYTGILAKEMIPILIAVCIIAIVILIIATNSFIEPFICLSMIAIAAVLNMGTNFIFEKISAITSAIAIVLQIAITIDYVIILCKKVEEETLIESDYKIALAKAMEKTIIEILSSSLTTIAGLLVLCFMQFLLGHDLGLVLAKSVGFALLTTIFLMPSLMYILRNVLKDTKHKAIVINIRKFGKMIVKSKVVFAVILLLLVPFSIYFQSQVQYGFTDQDVSDIRITESRAPVNKLYKFFDREEVLAILVPQGDYETEKEIIKDIEKLDNVKKVTGLSNIELKDGVNLTDSLNVRQFSELLNIEQEKASLLYMAYGAQHGDYSPIFVDTESYSVPLFKMLQYTIEKVDEGFISLDGDNAKLVNDNKTTLGSAINQMIGENYDRIVVSVSVVVDSEEAVKLVDDIKNLAQSKYKDKVYTFGTITSTRDIKDTFLVDKNLISVLSIITILIIVIFSFKNIFGAIILVFVIQSAIWLNFAYLYFSGDRPIFLALTIVTAIQMGATIDYAIILMNRYITYKKKMIDKKDAMVEAINDSFSTIVVSGSIFMSCGFLVGLFIDDMYISHIGLAIGRGALISIIVVFTALPQLILLFDKLIDKTSFGKKKNKINNNESEIVKLSETNVEENT